LKFLDYPEQQKHGDQDFPYYFYHVTHLHPRYMMPYHWHPLCEIIHVLSGHFHLQLEDCELLLAPGDSAFISPGDTHGGAPREAKGCCYECLLMDLDAIFLSGSSGRIYERRMVDLLNQKILIRQFFPKKCVVINGIIRKMLELLRYRPDGYTLFLQGDTFLLFGQLLQNGYYDKASERKPLKRISNLKEVLAFIEEHYAEDIVLADLAACANMNSNYFCRYFREILHRTPMDYLNYYRVEAACEQLSYTDKTITEIAFDCGFRDASYFVKVFRRYKGMTPSAYLRNDYSAPQ